MTSYLWASKGSRPAIYSWDEMHSHLFEIDSQFRAHFMVLYVFMKSFQFTAAGTKPQLLNSSRLQTIYFHYLDFLLYVIQSLRNPRKKIEKLNQSYYVIRWPLQVCLSSMYTLNIVNYWWGVMTIEQNNLPWMKVVWIIMSHVHDDFLVYNSENFMPPKPMFEYHVTSLWSCTWNPSDCHALCNLLPYLLSLHNRVPELCELLPFNIHPLDQ